MENTYQDLITDIQSKNPKIGGKLERSSLLPNTCIFDCETEAGFPFLNSLFPTLALRHPGAPGPKLCPSVASIKQRTTVNQKYRPLG